MQRAVGFSFSDHLKGKNSLRAFYNKRGAGLSPSLKRKKQKRIVQMLEQLPLWKTKGAIAVYQALKDEPCLSSFYNLRKNRICWPVVQNGGLAFYRDKGGRWQKNQFQIPEPSVEGKNQVPLKDISVFLIPGRVFDRQGGRLGRGYGYYDRTLAGLKKTKKAGVGKRRLAGGRKSRPVEGCKLNTPLFVGLAFAEQIHNQALPLLPHDVVMDILVTDCFILMPLEKRGVKK